ncbi:hypothetical protein JCM33374_g2026 [Metschnikowia sp. JCM 33374]|nr:hypothetical protein JCM33374_g2026 [Metschnikowia sp. JCM 33374]
MSDIDSVPGRDDTVATPHGVIVSPSTPGDLSTEGGSNPGDSSPESPDSGRSYSLDRPCGDKFSIYPLKDQTYLEMHAVPEYPRYDVSVPSDLTTQQ